MSVSALSIASTVGAELDLIFNVVIRKILVRWDKLECADNPIMLCQRGCFIPRRQLEYVAIAHLKVLQ